MSGSWTIEIKLEAETFPDLQNATKRILNEVATARSYKNLPGSGANSAGIRYWVKCSSPVEFRIKELRREADALETSLNQ